MSDTAASAPPAATGSSVQGAPLTAGAMLRHAREAAGLHIGALAVSLKVPVRKLEALESDRLDLLPDAVFARALAASVCRTLKVDAGAVLDLLPGQVAPRLQPVVHASRAPLDSPGSGWRLPLASRLSKPVVAAAGLLLAAALALLFVPGLDGSRKLNPGSKVPAVASGSPGAESAPALPVAAPPPIPSGTPDGATQVNASFALAASAPVAVPVAVLAAVPGAATSSEKAQDGPTGSSLVTFRAHGSSWVEVTDASGVVQLRKTLAGGEEAGASGKLPLAVVVGRADSTEVLVRGQAFDLSPVVRDNVARFQIK